MRMRLLLPLAFAALFAGGCAGEPSAEPAQTRPEPPPCRPGSGHPITEAALKSAFAAEGIQLYRDPDCFTDELVLLSNSRDAGPPPEEGDIFCSLHESGRESARIHRYVWRNDPDPTHIEVSNVNCAVYPEREGLADTVERAIRRLPSVSPLPTTVPAGGSAVRD